MPIKILPDDIVARIAAGEVVERPASVVKELVENAIDAGATAIKVEVREGGKRLVRVIDDGGGIPADEVELAFAHHATSKLTSPDDLFAIQTLGFRGEALPSIAAVSQVTIVTRAAAEQIGSYLRLEGGRVVQRQGRGAPQGTVVTVENLFYNTPARLKFLRTTATEAGHITDLVSSYALAYPELRFSLLNEGRLTFQSTGSGELYDVLVKAYGLEVARQMLRIEREGAGPSSSVALVPSVHGYVSSPSLHRSSRKYLTFFVNRRWVQDRMLSYAVTEAYHTLLPAGRQPIAVLNIELDPAEVDVNVHPAKSEVRFRQGQQVFALVQRTVRRVLTEQASIPTITRPATLPGPQEWARHQQLVEIGRKGRPGRGELALELQRTATEDELPAAQFRIPEARLPVLRVLGQMAQTYIVAEGPEGMYLIDQHAAHERVLYERLRAERAGAKVAVQGLLEPLTLELSPPQAAVVADQLEALSELGFDLSPFGERTYLLRAVPAILKEADIRRAMQEIIDELGEGLPSEREKAARLITSVCKQGAIKAGQTLSLPEMRELVHQLEQTTSPYTCPHGRPTMVHLSQAQLAREFGRG